MMEVVKVRKSGNCVIITLPKAILQVSALESGDRVVIDASIPNTFTVTKEEKYGRD